MVRSLIVKGEEGGWLPNFPAWNSYTSAMIGDHGAVMITDAYVKGIRGFDAEEAYRLMRKNATESPGYALYADGRGRRALPAYLRYGFIPLEEPVNRSLPSRRAGFADAGVCVRRLRGFRNGEGARQGRGLSDVPRARGQLSQRDRPLDGICPRASCGWFLERAIRSGRQLPLHHGGAAVPIHVLRAARFRGADPPGGRARSFPGQIGCTVRRQILRSRERAESPHRLSVRLRGRALEDPGACAASHGKRIPRPTRGAGRQRRLRADVGVVRAERVGILPGDAGDAGVRDRDAAVR